ncbi:hypothetical protein Poly51_30020 [Rubripirellula tenax]|uniref:Secreted protein n=1 Tax=Rubripirellula tenax TaxID=2528015 RepID=A0A5C6FBS7_9BACT|nr:hypothetical protein [Rubripirellula tenax]TWU57081.1 hypothetical protein Poly51_30020 [Rubripirellula tenax]
MQARFLLMALLLTAAFVGCGGDAPNRNVMDNADEDKIAEYNRMILDEADSSSEAESAEKPKK